MSDPSGDGEARKLLDITAVDVRNRDHAIRTTVTFRRAGRGDLIFLVQARGEKRGQWAHIVNRHRPRKADETTLAGGPVDPECSGVSVHWSDQSATLSLPSGCFHSGDYGAIHLRVLTEQGAIDVDYYAEPGAATWQWTPWISRG